MLFVNLGLNKSSYQGRWVLSELHLRFLSRELNYFCSRCFTSSERWFGTFFICKS